MIIQVGGSISFAPHTADAKAKWLDYDTRHMLTELDPKPEFVTVTTGTTLWDIASMFHPEDIKGTHMDDPKVLEAWSGMVVDSTPALQLNSAVSRKTHGAAGPFDIDLPLTGAAGVECRSGAGNHTLVVQFTNDVVSGNANVTSGTGVAGVPSVAGNVLTVPLSGVAEVQRITVTLSGVTDEFAQVLPNVEVTMGVLTGDSNGDAVVNSGDALQTRSRSGQTTDATNFRSDVNADGVVNSGDTLAVRSRSGTFLP
jgi:hypothetical protein